MKKIIVIMIAMFFISCGKETQQIEDNFKINDSINWEYLRRYVWCDNAQNSFTVVDETKQ